MRVYIAGPMRGFDLYNFPAFDAARDLLRSAGHEPVSPADMDREHGVDGTVGVSEHFVRGALRRDFLAILDCDAIAFLPGWEQSSGARAERHVAESVGLPCYRIDPEATFYRESYIGIAGVARAGKDTLARLISSRGYEHRSFAGPLKGILYALNPVVPLMVDAVEERPLDEPVVVHDRIAHLVDAVGWEEAKGVEDVRRLLQRLGTEGGRHHLGDDVWVETLFRSPSSGRVVVSDVRFPNEARAIRDRGGIVARITRPGIQAVNAHASEHALDDFDFDVEVVNDGSIADLRRAVDDILALAPPT